MTQELKDRTLLYKLINRLSRLCQGMDRELDSHLGKLKVLLDKNVDISTLEPALLKIDHMLKRQLEHQSGNAQSIVNAVREFGPYLQKIKGLQPELRRELRVFLAKAEAYGSFESQQRLIQLFDFYHRALQHKVGSLSDLESNSAEIDQRPHQQMCDELQQIITDLDPNENSDPKLLLIRKQLLEGVQAEQLSSLCLNLIKNIVNGRLKERDSSQEFLLRLNESLNLFHDSFHQNLSNTSKLSAQQVSLNQALKEGMAKISKQVSVSVKFDDLKSSITQHLSEINDYLLEKDALAERECYLQKQLQSMEAQLKSMKDEAAEYKKLLTVQQKSLYLDSLTKLHNRAALDERLELEFKRWQRYGCSLCLAVIDIDKFKNINDTYGHLAGDKALQVIAMSLQKSLRETDFIARFGGEEFVILLPNLSDDNFQKPLDSLREKIKEIPFKFKNSKVSITISIGVTLFKKGDEPMDVFERADNALYQAKNAGRDCIKVCL